MKLENKKKFVEFRVFVKINAKKTELISIDEKELTVAIHAKPHKGKANDELIAYLARRFKLPKNLIILKRGEKSRHKTLLMPLTEELKALLKLNK